MSGAVLQLLACSPTAACIDKRGLQSRGGCRTLQQLSDANPRFEVDSWLLWGENHNICTNVRMSTPNENENSLFVKKINVNSSQMFIIYVNIISLLHYEWLYHQIHLIYTLIGVCPTLTKILFKTSLSWKRKCILDIIHHLVTHTPHGQLTSTS